METVRKTDNAFYAVFHDAGFTWTVYRKFQ